MEDNCISVLLVGPCSCNDKKQDATQEGSNDDASTPSIAPRSRDGASALPVVHGACDNNGDVGMDYSALALSVIPCSREREGFMTRGKATASRCVERQGFG